jgi:hypothetical protein
MKKLAALLVVAASALSSWQWFQFHILDVKAVESDLRFMPANDLIDHKELSEARLKDCLDKSVAAHDLVLTAGRFEPVPMRCEKASATVPGHGQLRDPGDALTSFTVTGTLQRTWFGLTFSSNLDLAVVDACTDGHLSPANTASN